MELTFTSNNIVNCTISPFREMAAYEALWAEPKATVKKIADKFREASGFLPSELVTPSVIDQFEKELSEIFSQYHVKNIGIRINGSKDYPVKLRDAKNPIELFYFQGNSDLIDSPSVAIVGARKVSEEGKKRTHKIAKSFVEAGYTIVSGLAEGVDTAAHTAAIQLGGRTIAVIGTPISHNYPKQNIELQKKIAQHHLVVSQVPFKKYIEQDYRSNRNFFPERNVTMSAMTEATVIIEASDTSGTLYQARAALAQGRKLFILDSCFKNPDITWPEKFAKKGAIRVSTFEDIQAHL